jgi:putative chitobiose transport system permease protein
MQTDASCVATGALRRRQRTKVAQKSFSMFFLYAMLFLIAVFCAGPFIWMVSTSFKANENIYEMSLIPRNPTFANYVGVMEYLELPKYFLNTIIITFTGIFCNLLFSALCAYPLAKFDFYGKRAVVILLFVTQILPASAGAIVNFITIGNLGLMNTFAGVILPSAAGVFTIILFRQAYLSVPNEILESARIDGAGETHTWLRIMVPQILPTASTALIFEFIGKWNSFLWPIIILKPEKYPISAALNYLKGMFNFQYTYVIAATVLSIVPIIIVFVACQKNYINAVAGAIK